MGPFLSAPIRHGGSASGYIHLARDRGGPGFSQTDEETLVMFAAQAALVIANARRYRDEQRIRADLETLIETSASECPSRQPQANLTFPPPPRLGHVRSKRMQRPPPAIPI